MQRITLSLDEGTAQQFDKVVIEQGYQSRSEAMRDLIRCAVDARRLDGAQGSHCVASLSYVYNHRTRALAQRLLDMQHARHDLVVSTMHVILDHDTSLETVILKGPTNEVRRLADTIRAERGVRYGAINLVSVDLNDDHNEETSHRHAEHRHASPASA